MSEVIGVTGPHYFADSFKRELLFFDRICYPAAEQSLSFFRENPWFIPTSPAFVDELELLIARELVFDLVPLASDLTMPSSVHEALAQFRVRQQATLALASTARKAAETDAQLGAIRLLDGCLRRQLLVV